MNKTLLKIIIISIVVIILLYGFSDSYYANNITNISYVTALGIDLSEDEKNLKVTFEFMDVSQFSQNASSSEGAPILDTVTANSINSAINILDAYIGKQANLSHCKIVIFSDKVAQKGITSEITELMNNIQIRPSTNIVVCECEALEYLKNSTSALDKIITKYYDFFPNSSIYTGYTSDVTIGNFYNSLLSENYGNIAILGGVIPIVESESSSGGGQSSSEQSGSSQFEGEQSSSEQSSGNSENSSEENKNFENITPTTIVSDNVPIEGERGSVSIGIAVFKEDKYIGKLTALESLCHAILTDEVKTFTISIDNPEFYPIYIDLSLFHNVDNIIDIKIVDDTPIININTQFKGKVLGTKDDNETYKNLDINEISNASSKYLEKILNDYVNKTSSEFNCDINNFYNYAKKNFLTNDDWKNFDWSSKYKNAKFNINVKSDISFNLFGSEH